MTSLSDVASHASVSIATASRVLSGSSHPVSDKTRDRVREAAASLDYQYNALARGLVAGRTQMVAVIVHDILDEYFARIVRGIEDAAYARGYTTLVCNSDRDPLKEIAYVRKLRATRVDILVFAAGGMVATEFADPITAQLDQIERFGGVILRLAPQLDQEPMVYYSTSEGMDQISTHLAEIGHKKVLYAPGPEHIVTTNLRASRFETSARQMGLEVIRLKHTEFSRGGGADLVGNVVTQISNAAGPTAVVAANGQIAVGLLHGLADAGVKVPQDISLCCFGDLSSCSDVQPSITAVALPLYKLGFDGISYAISILEGTPQRRPTSLATKLIARESTATARHVTRGASTADV